MGHSKQTRAGQGRSEPLEPSSQGAVVHNRTNKLFANDLPLVVSTGAKLDFQVSGVDLLDLGQVPFLVARKPSDALSARHGLPARVGRRPATPPGLGPNHSLQKLLFLDIV